MSRTVLFPVPPSVVLDYLADPAHRAEWQSSLARVEDVAGPVGVGQTWTDVTVPGLRPRMRTTALVPGERWSETGTWRGLEADLTLEVAPAPGEASIVSAQLALRGRGPVGLLARALEVVAPAAVRSDLRRAARILRERPPPAPGVGDGRVG
ncbi:SRPBCC family protein [Nocardioides sp. zg-579]|uniref:SRPBCC family protein n=1 Tax=Nocardioides marmotae TaxID=2663857 RepID=A0A6I3JFJ1_9ACTN|nr:SRPBCC family protein [Nocardioides marmotae]MCR6033232.1 SRPBCC family protein [Gordonia jinghuaiqii]MTB96887.1 SRPBCC family protein [Nocardioides marmotae]QKE02925.1 SRPBCC family protein [Nocardioides marmotae]